MSDSGSADLFTTSIFNPALLRKEDLVRGFVARQELLERLLDDIRRVQPGCPPQHQLLIGQRGLGKTTLLRRLAFAIEDDPQLSALWMPLVFPEEQYNVKNLSDFWLNCADALSDALDRTGEKQAAETLDQQVERIPADPGQRSAAALALLVNETGRLRRGLVLLVDNIDIVLDRLNESEEWEFRRVISAEPRLYIIGASSRALEVLYEHGRAFYDYFQVYDLKALNDAEMFALLGRLAEDAGDDQVQRLTQEKPGRLRALRVLTGGNPRTLVMLYRVLSQGPEGDAQRDMEQLLDLYTPLYKARFEEMAQQSQQVVDAMAIHWDPLTAADLAAKLAPLSVNQVSAQLKRLEDFGVVEKAPWFGEKKTAFQIAERFFNIWYLMRASRRVRRRLLWLVKFLEAWFEHEELSERAAKYLQQDPKAVGSGRYAEMALAYSQTVDDPNLRRSLESAGLRAALDVSVRGQFDFSDLPPELQGRKERMERLSDLRSRVLAVQFDGIVAEELWRVLGGAPHLLLEEKAKIVDDLPTLEPSKVRDLYTKMKRAKETIRQTYREHSADVDRLYEALGSGEMVDVYDVDDALAVASRFKCDWLPTIGIASRTNFDLAPQKIPLLEAETAETALRRLGSCPGYEAKSWNGLGLLKKRLGRYEEAEQAYRRAIELDPNSTYPWNSLGNVLTDHLKRHKEAEKAYRHAIELDPTYGNPWNNLGILLTLHLGRHEEAEKAYRQAIGLDPTSRAPWNNLGNVLTDDLGRHEEAEKAYRRAIELDPTSGPPWNNLGKVLTDHLGRHEEAEKAYRRAIELDPASSNPWYGLGNVLTGHLGRHEEAEKAYRQAIELDATYSNAWNGLGNVLAHHLKKPDEAEQAYRRAIELDPKLPYAWGNLARLIELDADRQDEALTAFFQAWELDSTNDWRRREAFRKARSLGTGTPLPRALQAISRLHEHFPQDRELAFVLAGLLTISGNWAQASELLQELAASEVDQPGTWAFRAAIETGHLSDVIALLKRTGADERWRPLYEALQAVQAGSAQYLQRVAPEVRTVAEGILAEIAPGLGATDSNPRKQKKRRKRK